MDTQLARGTTGSSRQGTGSDGYNAYSWVERGKEPLEWSGTEQRGGFWAQGGVRPHQGAGVFDGDGSVGA